MPPSTARTVAALVSAIEALALVAICVLYAVDLSRGQASDTTRAVMSIVVMLVMAALLLALAWAWRTGRARPRIATGVWNVLLLPVAWSLLTSGQVWLGALLLAVAVCGIGAAIAPSSQVDGSTN